VDTTARRTVVALAVGALLLTGIGSATAEPSDRKKTVYTREQTKEMANWLADHGNMVGFAQATTSMPNPQALLMVNGYAAYWKDTINEAARKNDCVFIQRFAPGVGGDSAPYIGMGC
jgi:hypothetical protein